MQEADQGRLEIAWVPAHRLLELGRSAGEEQLPVGQEQHPGGVALDLADVVGGEDHGRAQARDELPQPLALARVKRRRWLVEFVLAPRRLGVSLTESVRWLERRLAPWKETERAS